MSLRFNEVKPGDGVYEWAGYSYNIGQGCSNNCRYCYACSMNLEMSRKDGIAFKRVDWPHDQVKEWKTEIHQHVDGIVMFPSMHDITLTYLPCYARTLRNILDAGNQVVIVTKPRYDCIEYICERFQDYKDMMLFRMTITSLNDEVSEFWEPGAPLPSERIEALRLAYRSGYQTSVSVEPMLDHVYEVAELYDTVLPYLTEDIWFGKMNDIDHRVEIVDQLTREAVDLIREQQSDRYICQLHGMLADKEMVRWKDSIRKVVGI